LATARILGQQYYPSPAVYQWSFGLQQRISAHWAANLDYIGSHTIHNQQWVQLNPGELPVGSLANLSLQERRRLRGWAGIDSWVPWGSGKYHSGTLGIKNRDWKGLSFMSNLTWAKNLTTSYSLIDSDRGNPHWRYYDNWRGRSNYIPTLRSVSAWSYNLPFGRSMKYKLSGLAD